MVGQELAHQLARIQPGEQLHRDQLGQLVTCGQLCYFERHESTPFWLIRAFLLQYARLRVLLSSYLNGIVITAPDRLARNYVHQMLLIEELEQGGCQVEFIDRPMSYMLPEKICGIGLVYFRLVPAVSSFPGLDIPQVQHRSI